MKSFTLTLVLSAVLVLGLTPAVESQEGKAPEFTLLVKSNDEFAVDLYHQLGKNDGNLFFSPYSISNALAMTYAGARGQTAAEIAKTLHFVLPADKLHPAFAALIKQLNGDGQARKFELTVANRLWGQQGLGFEPDFLKVNQDYYGAGLKEVNYGAPEAARQEINAWVEQQTKDKIKELIKPNLITVDTRLVLTNAIYFKASWHRVFDAKATAAGKFLLPGGKTVDVPLMHQLVDAGYLDGGSFALLDLPYEQGDLSMVIMLPKEVAGLAALEKSSTAAKLAAWLSKREHAKVKVTLPKFKLTSEFRLDEALKSLGMKTAFVPADADFSAMTKRERLWISAVVHKAFVDVHEKGTEAAAATAVIMEKKSAPAEPVTFRADHPFVFLIRDNHTGSILFMGRVMNPAG
jgi:serpin B